MNNENVEIFNMINTKILKIRYCKNSKILAIMLKLTKYKNFSMQTRVYSNNFEQGYLSLGIDFIYRLKNVDHLGFEMVLKLLFFEVETGCEDSRHIEDYKE